MQKLGHSNEVNSQSFWTNRLAAGNLLKALGPDDDLTTAVSELNNLLKYETQIIATQINHTVSHIADTMDESVQINREVRAQTAATARVAQSQIGILNRVDGRMSKVQNGHNRTAAKVDRLEVTMNRIEASSQASWEEANEKLDSVISGIRGTILSFACLIYRTPLGQ